MTPAWFAHCPCGEHIEGDVADVISFWSLHGSHLRPADHTHGAAGIQTKFRHLLCSRCRLVLADAVDTQVQLPAHQLTDGTFEVTNG